MRNPMQVWRELIERAYPEQEFDEDAYQRAVDYCEQPAEQPRCDVTGQPLTPRQQYERECG